MKTLPSGVLAALEEGRFAIRVLLKAELLSGDSGVWNGAHAITYNSLTYKPLGGNMDVEGIPGSGELSADRVRVTFSGLDPDALSLVEPGEWHQRPAVVMLAYLDEGEIVAHVEAVFSGFIDMASQSDAADATATLVATLESNNRELDRASGRTYSDSRSTLSRYSNSSHSPIGTAHSIHRAPRSPRTRWSGRCSTARPRYR